MLSAKLLQHMQWLVVERYCASCARGTAVKGMVCFVYLLVMLQAMGLLYVLQDVAEVMLSADQLTPAADAQPAAGCSIHLV
jgi:hypothetical protein